MLPVTLPLFTMMLAMKCRQRCMKVMVARREGVLELVLMLGTDAWTCGSTGADDVVTVIVMILRATNSRSIMLGLETRF